MPLPTCHADYAPPLLRALLGPFAHDKGPHSMMGPPRPPQRDPPHFSTFPFRSPQPNCLQFLKYTKTLPCLCLYWALCPACPFLLDFLMNNQLLIILSVALADSIRPNCSLLPASCSGLPVPHSVSHLDTGVGGSLHGVRAQASELGRSGFKS